MNTVAAKIPSVFHRNVDAEGKKKRGEHERNFNNKEKNPGSTAPNPHPTTTPKPTHNPTARVCVEFSFFCTGCLPRLVDPVCPVEGVLGYQVSRVGVGQGVVPVSLSARLRTRMAQTPVVI